jgi:hypothetical protein
MAFEKWAIRIKIFFKFNMISLQRVLYCSTFTDSIFT